MSTVDVPLDPVSPAGREATPRPTLISDPTPAAFAVFAFALAVYGVRFVGVNDSSLASGPATVALNYAVLAAAVANLLCGVIALARGLSYPGYVMTVFGSWLIGFFFVITAGDQKAFTPDAVAWYVLLLEVPVLILAVPPFAHRDIPLMVAFVALAALVLLLGLGFHDLYHALNTAAATHHPPALSSPVNLLKISAYFAFLAAAAVWVKFALELYDYTGVHIPTTALHRH